ncbi:hypothetical protein Mapa_005921 [Marchantia paleacea]|nr:hypothetical protein Mapa_005921 [Marchantia paleacea]
MQHPSSFTRYRWLTCDRMRTSLRKRCLSSSDPSRLLLLMATMVPSLSLPVYTVPNPPAPICAPSAKLSVALFSSRRGINSAVSLSKRLLVAIISASCWCLSLYSLHRQQTTKQLACGTSTDEAMMIRSNHHERSIPSLTTFFSMMMKVGAGGGEELEHAGRGPPQSPGFPEKRSAFHKLLFSGIAGTSPERLFLETSRLLSFGSRVMLDGIGPVRLLLETFKTLRFGKVAGSNASATMDPTIWLLLRSKTSNVGRFPTRRKALGREISTKLFPAILNSLRANIATKASKVALMGSG